MQCAVCSVLCAVCSVQCVVSGLQREVWSVKGAVWTVQCVVFSSSHIIFNYQSLRSPTSWARLRHPSYQAPSPPKPPLTPKNCPRGQHCSVLYCTALTCSVMYCTSVCYPFLPCPAQHSSKHYNHSMNIENIEGGGSHMSLLPRPTTVRTAADA